MRKNIIQKPIFSMEQIRSGPFHGKKRATKSPVFSVGRLTALPVVLPAWKGESSCYEIGEIFLF
jgi:hypothetical protein